MSREVVVRSEAQLSWGGNPGGVIASVSISVELEVLACFFCGNPEEKSASAAVLDMMAGVALCDALGGRTPITVGSWVHRWDSAAVVPKDGRNERSKAIYTRLAADLRGVVLAPTVVEGGAEEDCITVGGVDLEAVKRDWNDFPPDKCRHLMVILAVRLGRLQNSLLALADELLAQGQETEQCQS